MYAKFQISQTFKTSVKRCGVRWILMDFLVISSFENSLYFTKNQLI